MDLEVDVLNVGFVKHGLPAAGLMPDWLGADDIRVKKRVKNGNH